MYIKYNHIKFIAKNIMNSLRTDDILGAKPRVRHMPKDLIRERRVAQPYFPNIQPSNPEWNHSGASPNFTKN